MDKCTCWAVRASKFEKLYWVNGQNIPQLALASKWGPQQLPRGLDSQQWPPLQAKWHSCPLTVVPSWPQPSKEISKETTGQNGSAAHWQSSPHSPPTGASDLSFCLCHLPLDGKLADQNLVHVLDSNLCLGCIERILLFRLLTEVVSKTEGKKKASMKGLHLKNVQIIPAPWTRKLG